VCHQLRSLNCLGGSRWGCWALHISMCLPQLCQPHGQQAPSQKPAASREGTLLPRSFLALSQQQTVAWAPSSASLSGATLCLHVLLVPHLHICNFPLQMGKSALAQESSPVLQQTLPTPWYLFPVVRRSRQQSSRRARSSSPLPGPLRTWQPQLSTTCPWTSTGCCVLGSSGGRVSFNSVFQRRST